MDENTIKEDKNNPQQPPVNELEECKKKCDEYLNNWKRERADFLNYKKEEIERIGLLAKYTKEETILKMLPILDSIYLAEKALPAGRQEMPENPKFDTWLQGFLQTKKQIDTFLEKEGLQKIDAIDQLFDPNTMEAVEAVEDKEKQPNVVIEELQKGYMMDGKVLRPAKVKITK